MNFRINEWIWCLLIDSSISGTSDRRTKKKTAVDEQYKWNQYVFVKEEKWDDDEEWGWEFYVGVSLATAIITLVCIALVAIGYKTFNPYHVIKVISVY